MKLADIFVLTVGLLSIFTNGVLLIILVKDPLKCFKASTTYFIICLSLSDLLTGANACFWAIENIFPFSLEVQKYMLALFWITIQVSFLTLLAMSVERFLIVKYPFYCRIWITKKRVSLFIALIWLVSAVLGGLLLLPSSKLLYVEFAIFTEFFLSVFVIAALYASILLGIKNSQKVFRGSGGLHQGGGRGLRVTSLSETPSRRIASYRVDVTATSEPSEIQNNNGVRESAPEAVVAGTTENGTRKIGQDTTSTGDIRPVVETSGGTKTWQECDRRNGPPMNGSRKLEQLVQVTQTIKKTRARMRHIQQEKKLTAVVLLLVGVLALTVLPYLLASQIQVGYIIFCKCSLPPGLRKFVIFYFPIELLNFAVNPLIYAWRLPQYRRTLKHLCTTVRHQTSGNVDGSMVCERDTPTLRSVSERIQRE